MPSIGFTFRCGKPQSPPEGPGVQNDNLIDQLDRLLDTAQRESRRTALSTHEAKAHFRAAGRADLAERIHEVLCQLAERRAAM